MRVKIKAPKETKAQLMEQVGLSLIAAFDNPAARVEFLLNFFTAADLVGILEELKR